MSQRIRAKPGGDMGEFRLDGLMLGVATAATQIEGCLLYTSRCV